MNKEQRNIIKKIKDYISGLGWVIFIEFSGQTEEEYWNDIYEQEKNLKSNKQI